MPSFCLLWKKKDENTRVCEYPKGFCKYSDKCEVIAKRLGAKLVFINNTGESYTAGGGPQFDFVNIHSKKSKDLIESIRRNKITDF